MCRASCFRRRVATNPPSPPVHPRDTDSASCWCRQRVGGPPAPLVHTRSKLQTCFRSALLQCCTSIYTGGNKGTRQMTCTAQNRLQTTLLQPPICLSRISRIQSTSTGASYPTQGSGVWVHRIDCGHRRCQIVLKDRLRFWYNHDSHDNGPPTPMHTHHADAHTSMMPGAPVDDEAAAAEGLVCRCLPAKIALRSDNNANRRASNLC